MTQSEKETQPTNAIIYCRVSSRSQEADGHGLESQETRCRQHAIQKGYEVTAVFPDTITGGGDFMQRPGMVALLSFLDAQPDERFVVIFDDLKRFARDTRFHLDLREAFRKRNAAIECLNFKFDDTPEGEFIETIMAAQGALERKQNGRQVAQKMRARLMNGYWCFRAPVGYKHAVQKGHGKMLVRDEPVASIVQEALEGYALGRFQSQAEVKRFLESQPAYPKSASGDVLQQRVTDILTSPLYAGFVGYDGWKVSTIPGKHDGLISVETFEKIQKRRSETTKAPARKDINRDFPLRGFVCCADCSAPLTACWSKGKYKKYAYYLCDKKGCPSYRKSIRKEQLEGDFEPIIQSLQPTAPLLDLVVTLFKNAWDQRAAQAQAIAQTLKADIKAAQRQIDSLLDRIVDASNPSVINAYETKIGDLEKQKLIMREKAAQTPPDQGTFDKSIELALAFFTNPWKLWALGSFEGQRLLLRLAFADRVAYDRKTGYRTPDFALPFKALSHFTNNKCEMVPRRGITSRSRSVPRPLSKLLF